MPSSCCCCCCSTTSCKSLVMILICSCFGAKKKSTIRGVKFSVNGLKGKKKTASQRLSLWASTCSFLFFKPFFLLNHSHLPFLSLFLALFRLLCFFFHDSLLCLFILHLPLSVTPQFCYCFYFCFSIHSFLLLLLLLFSGYSLP